MAYALFITRNDIIKNTPLQGSIDADRLLNFVRTAQDKYLLNLLGTVLFDYLQAQIIAGTFSQRDVYYQDLMNDHIKPTLIWYAVVEYLPFSGVQFKSEGAVKHETETANKILETARSYDVRLVGIERGMAKNAVLPYLQDLMKRKSFFISVTELTHGNKKKTDRIVWALQGRFEHGRIKLVRGEWNKQFVDQLLNFPNSQVHDDLIDALAYIDQIGITEFTDMVEDDEYEALDPISGY